MTFITVRHHGSSYNVINIKIRNAGIYLGVYLLKIRRQAGMKVVAGKRIKEAVFNRNHDNQEKGDE
ncbi:hypothetical protein M4D81_25175 [Paenibacillus sp. p3-SID867]|uniref:hypothetical protein n=1 Tax=Paenibacillus sp. p3-SID867 TaxID=2916363 RepID=UPI0021A42429|nr:hypothetical protein [Paenibacillus sp. p3-SID867]MCT1402295.1 hypothetical protein [Paenibacillus sp. p3-SID867]